MLIHLVLLHAYVLAMEMTYVQVVSTPLDPYALSAFLTHSVYNYMMSCLWQTFLYFIHSADVSLRVSSEAGAGDGQKGTKPDIQGLPALLIVFSERLMSMIVHVQLVTVSNCIYML